MAELSGKVVAMTGAASGIGRATAKELVASGALVVAGDLNEAGLAEVATEVAELPGKLTVVKCDVTHEDDVKALIARAVSEHGRLDGLVNVAGIGGFAHTHQTSIEHWNRFISINLTGTFATTLHALPHLIETKGAVVNIASQAAMKAHPYAAAYCASKGGVLMMTKALALEYAAKGVRFNAVCPGGIKTPILKDFAPLPDGDMSLLMRISPPMQRFGRPHEVGKLVAYLLSADASYITGESIIIDGGSAL